MSGTTTAAVILSEVGGIGLIAGFIIGLDEGYISRWWDAIKGAIPTSSEWDKYVRKLQRDAKRYLCYEYIARLEFQIYGGEVWTQYDGRVREKPVKWPTLPYCHQIHKHHPKDSA